LTVSVFLNFNLFLSNISLCGSFATMAAAIQAIIDSAVQS